MKEQLQRAAFINFYVGKHQLRDRQSFSKIFSYSLSAPYKFV